MLHDGEHLPAAFPFNHPHVSGDRALVDPSRRAAYEPLYDIDPRTGASAEVFYADRVLAESFGARGASWFWWADPAACRTGFRLAPLLRATAHIATRWMEGCKEMTIMHGGNLTTYPRFNRPQGLALVVFGIILFGVGLYRLVTS